ncbi:MAG: hypothetical protein NVSMB1_04830 [Polyangiales bacterium]
MALPTLLRCHLEKTTVTRKLVHTWKPDWDDQQPTIVTYRLEPMEGGTRVTLRHEGFTSHDSCGTHADGWLHVFGWLRAFLAPKRAHSFFLIR